MSGRDQLVPEAQKLYDQFLSGSTDSEERTRAGSHVGLVADADVLGEVLDQSFKADLDRAREAFARFDYAGARAAYAAVREAARKVVGIQPDVASSLSRAALGEGISALNLQDTPAARELLLLVDRELLNQKQKYTLAIGLAHVGEVKLAREALPGLVPADGEAAEEAHLVVLLAEGGEPEDLPKSAASLAHVGLHLLEKKRVAAATDSLLAAARLEMTNPLLRASLVNGLVVCLARTLTEQLLDDSGVPVGVRGKVLQTIDSLTHGIDHSTLPPILLRQYLEHLRDYYSLVGYRDALEAVERVLQPRPPSEEAGFLREAIRLAEAGELSVALEVLPPDEHPWRRELAIVELLSASGATGEAIERVTGLSQAWPRRPLIDGVAARLLSNVGRFVDARLFAERAIEFFPSKRLRLELARILLNLQFPDEALPHLTEYLSDGDPEVAMLLGYAYGLQGDPREVDSWAALTRLRPRDPDLQVRLALAKSRHGDEEEGGKLAAGLIGEYGAVLELDDLHTCAQLALLAQHVPANARAVRDAAELIARRFNDDARAEYSRLQLLVALGFPQGTRPIDYERLADAGLLRRVPHEEASNAIRHSRELAATALAAYHEGKLTFESFCRIGQVPAALCVTRIANASGSPALRLRTPVKVPGLSGPTEFKGRQLLTSALELLVLEQLGVLDDIANSLNGGALLVFPDVWDRMAEERHHLESVAQRSELARLDAALVLLGRHEKLRVLDDKNASLSIPVVYIESPPAPVANAIYVAAGALLKRLQVEGFVPATVLEASLRTLSDEHRTHEPTSNVHPEYLLEVGVLELFQRTGALEGLVKATKKHLFLSEDAVRSLRAQHEESSSRVAAADLAGALQRKLAKGRREGWFRVAAGRPSVVLPDARTPGELPDQVLRQPLVSALSYKDALLANPEWLRISADSLGTEGIGHHVHLVQLAWAGEAEVREFWARYRSVAEREATLPAVVRACVPEGRRLAALAGLADLGVVDALTGAEIVELTAQFGTVLRGRLGELLTKTEAPLCEATDWADLGRLRLASIYAEAVWEEYCGLGAASDGSPRPSFELLERAWRIDRQYSLRFLEQVVGDVTLLAISHPKSSFVPSGPAKLIPSLSSRAGKLWEQLAHWARGDDERESSIMRGVAYGWLVLERLHATGPANEADWIPVDLATRVVTDDALPGAVPHPDSVLAIVSAGWAKRPLAERIYKLESSAGVRGDLNAEEALIIGARALGTKRIRRWSGALMVYKVTVANTDVTLDFEAVPEAILLRAESSVIAVFARKLAGNLGPFDGRAYRLLMTLAAAPDNVSVRRQLARAACSYPCRLVYDDPTLPLSWGARSLGEDRSYPASLEELREMLSEPAGGLADRTPIGAVEASLNDGGEWSQRTDAGQLLVMAGRTPGPLANLASGQLVESKSADDWAALVSAATSPWNLSIGSLSQTAAWLLGGMVAQRIADPSVVQRALEGLEALVSVRSQSGSAERHFEDVEPGVLAALGLVVARVASPVQVTVAEGRWLTLRVYEWWANIVADDRRVDVAMRIAARGQGRSLPSDEWRFARLAAVLCSFLDVIEPTLVKGGSLASIRPLLPSLVQLANSPDAASMGAPAAWRDLGWKRAHNCSALAIACALWIDPNAFAELSAEARLRVLEDLPMEASRLEGEHGLAVLGIIRAVTQNMKLLRPEERRALRSWLSQPLGSQEAVRWKVYCYVELLAVGENDVAAPLVEATLANASHPAGAEFLQLLLRVLARRYEDSPDMSLGALQQLLEHQRTTNNENQTLEAYRSLVATPTLADAERDGLVRLFEHAGLSGEAGT